MRVSWIRRSGCCAVCDNLFTAMLDKYFSNIKEKSQSSRFDRIWWGMQYLLHDTYTHMIVQLSWKCEMFEHIMIILLLVLERVVRIYHHEFSWRSWWWSLRSLLWLNVYLNFWQTKNGMEVVAVFKKGTVAVFDFYRV